jgi:hypothetical protein
MSGQQPPPYPGPYGQQPPDGPPPGQPPPDGPPPGQPPPYPGPPGQPPPGQQPPPYPGPPAQPSPYPGPYGQPPAGQPGYPPQQYPAQQYPPQQYPQYAQQPYQGYPPTGYAPAPKQPPDSTARMIGWILAGTALVVGIAAFMTWGTIEFQGRSFDINGVTGSDVPGDDEAKDGIITLIFAIPVLGFGIVRAFGSLSLTAGIIGTVMGTLIALIGVADIVDIQDKKEDLEIVAGGVEVSIGIGLWLTLIGGIAMTVVGIFGIVKRR